MPKSEDVIRSESHQNEDLSKLKFEAIIQPWIVSWVTKDYGIDAMVQTASPIDGKKDMKIERNSFHVQLKSIGKLKISETEIVYPLPVKKVQQWIGSNVPVLFVLYDVASDVFFYSWMDMRQLDTIEDSNPTWASQKSISIRIPTANKLESDSLLKLNQTIINFRRPTISWIEPGRFFELKERCHQSVNEFFTIAKQFPFASTAKQLEAISVDVEKSIYRIAVTGLSRVGKSSLINALLKKDICPVGFFQTTSVPIEILPGRRERITVYFLDGQSESYENKPDIIEAFASQDHNPDNKKRVARVSISIHNRNLQRGVSVFDVPGLDDPDESIVNYTLETVHKVNAILYVIDASPAQNGGFIFKKEYKQHILSFRQNLEKIFLVFSKADALTPEKLALLKDRIIKDLKKWDLYESISDKIYFITNLADKQNELLDKVEKLEGDIWSYVINENRGGIARLALLNKSVAGTLNDFHDLLNVRMMDAKKRGQLKAAIYTIENRVPELDEEIRLKLGALEKSIQGLLISMKNELLIAFEQWLEKTPIDSFPSKEMVKQFILIHLNKAMEAANLEYGQGMHQIKNYADNWIENNLRQIRQILSSGAANRVIEFSELEQFESPVVDVSSSIGVGVIGWILGYLVVPEFAVLAGVIGFFANLVMSQEQKRVSRIFKTVKNCRQVCDQSYDRLSQQYKEIAYEQIEIISHYLDDKLTLYFSDLEVQIQGLPEISEIERQKYISAFTDIKLLNKRLIEFDQEISKY